MTVLSDCRRFEEDKIYADSFLGCLWRLSDKTDAGAVLKSVSPYMGAGMSMRVNPESVTLCFYPEGRRLAGL